MYDRPFKCRPVQNAREALSIMLTLVRVSPMRHVTMDRAGTITVEDWLADVIRVEDEKALRSETVKWINMEHERPSDQRLVLVELIELERLNAGYTPIGRYTARGDWLVLVGSTFVRLTNPVKGFWSNIPSGAGL